MDTILSDIQAQANPQKAKDLMRFFKTGAGEYGEGDRFLGLMVPVQRGIAGKYYDRLTLNDVEDLLHSDFHECRLIALLILIRKYKKADKPAQQGIVSIYLRNTAYINNWDLVDLSARDIIGAYYYDRGREPLIRLARSASLWERRIAIISTSYFIARNDFADTLRIAELLLHDRHDLIHKAVGWMLREVGKRDLQTEETFLKRHYRTMPRTALRYAIERFEETKRRAYIEGMVR